MSPLSSKFCGMKGLGRCTQARNWVGGMLAARAGDRKGSPRLALRVRIVPLFGEIDLHA